MIIGNVLMQDAIEMLKGEIVKDRVIITGIGIFRARMSKPRVARNPKTGAMVQVPSKVKVGFKPAKSLLDALDGKLK